VLLQLGLLYK